MKTSILTYYGGKNKMLKYLIPMIPEHKTYVEAFVGGGALFFAKKPSSIEVLNDLNGFVSNFYQVSKNNFSQLNKLIQETLHDEFLYNKARNIYRKRKPASPIEKAWAFWVGCTMSFGGSCFDGSFQITTNSNDIAHPGKRTKNKRQVFTSIQGRLESVMILQKDALQVIKKYNNSDTFIYCDPPYFQANQGHYKGYTKEDFYNLLKIAQSSKSKILISCYYDDCVSDFTFHVRKIQMPLGVKNNATKEECLLFNYEPPKQIAIQTDLFKTAIKSI